MIINTGSRTDIPAFYSDWFFNRIKDGFVYVRNPYYPQQVTKYTLSPEVVDCLCFCTKNPAPMLDRLDEISNYGQFWFVTITPYLKDVERYVPHKEDVITSFQKLSRMLGPHKVEWRYDPIFITENYTEEFHLREFENIASKLSGYTDTCIISFIDLYKKTMRNFPHVYEVPLLKQIEISEKLVDIASKYKIKIKSCHESADLSQVKVDCSGCMTQPVIERALNFSLKVPKKQSVRDHCDCLLGTDIGSYNSCLHGCAYCYANYSDDLVKKNARTHDPCSPFLIGGPTNEDMIKEAKQVSFKFNQMNLF